MMHKQEKNPDRNSVRGIGSKDDSTQGCDVHDKKV